MRCGDEIRMRCGDEENMDDDGGGGAPQSSEFQPKHLTYPTMMMMMK